jgi:hypothetical protein
MIPIPIASMRIATARVHQPALSVVATAGKVVAVIWNPSLKCAV